MLCAVCCVLVRVLRLLRCPIRPTMDMPCHCEVRASTRTDRSECRRPPPTLCTSLLGDFSENPAENRLEGKIREIGPNSKLVAALNLLVPTIGTLFQAFRASRAA
eukprot:SAG25_NODE_4917_length_731_cov_2.636076_1_plen_105_part_00